MHIPFVTFDGLSIGVISKCLAWFMHNDKVIAFELDKIDVIKELLHVRFKHSTIPHFDITDIDIVVECLYLE